MKKQTKLAIAPATTAHPLAALPKTITPATASALVSEIIPYIAGSPQNDGVAFALMQIIELMAACDVSERENAVCVFQQAIYPHTDAFCRSLDYFAQHGAMPLAA